MVLVRTSEAMQMNTHNHRSAMRAANLLPGRGGGALMWMLPLYLHVNQKSGDVDRFR